MCSTEGISCKSPLLGLPNELFLEVASHLNRFKDLNSLARTSRFFHGMFNPQLYRRAVAANHSVLNRIVDWVLKASSDSRCRLASLTLLLDHGLSVNHTGRFCGQRCVETMLGYLCTRYEPYDLDTTTSLARLLIQRGADIEAKDSIRSQTLLHKAARRSSNCEIVALMLSHHDGAGVNAADMDGRTPLHHASISWRGDEMAKLLIAYGAAVDARDKYGITPLYWAISDGYFNIAQTLLAHGADGSVPDSEGKSLLHYAAACFDSQQHNLVKSLLENGALVNGTDVNGKTPLHYVWEDRLAKDNGLFMAKFLLENGADVNAVSNDGLTPLRYTFSRRYGDSVVALMLEHGADVSVLSKEERRLLPNFSRTTRRTNRRRA
jgi:ankyrin repeat protein